MRKKLKLLLHHSNKVRHNITLRISINYTKYDYRFFAEVAEIIGKINGGNPKALMETSSFYEMYEEDINFVQHYPPAYWADFIIEECDNIKKQVQ